jgi:hypothetical protein
MSELLERLNYVWGLGKGTKIGTFDSEYGARKGRGSQIRTKSHRSNYDDYSYIKHPENTTHAIILNLIFYVACKKKIHISSAG